MDSADALLNPTFCGAALWYFAKDYCKASKDKSVPYALMFLCLPLALHLETRLSLPKSTKASFVNWVEDNRHLRIGLAARAKVMVPRTQNGLLFLAECGALVLNDHVTLGDVKLKRSEKFVMAATDEVNACIATASFLGRWLAKTGTVATVFSLLGVRP